MLRLQLDFMLHDLKRGVEKRAVEAWFLLPPNVRHLFVAAELGRLSVLDPRLHGREVLTITTDEFLAAMKFERAAA